jgi:hypothetical protein
VVVSGVFGGGVPIDTIKSLISELSRWVGRAVISKEAALQVCGWGGGEVLQIW